MEDGYWENSERADEIFFIQQLLWRGGAASICNLENNPQSLVGPSSKKKE